MSAHVVPPTVSNVSTGTVASSFVTSVGTPVSTGVVYSVANVVSPSTSLASAATAIIGNQGKYQTSVTFLADLTSMHVDVKINLIATTAWMDEIALYKYIKGPSCSKSDYYQMHRKLNHTADFNFSHRNVSNWQF